MRGKEIFSRKKESDKLDNDKRISTNQNRDLFRYFGAIKLVPDCCLFSGFVTTSVNIVNLVNSYLNRFGQPNRDIGSPERFEYIIQFLINNINNRSHRDFTYDIRIKCGCFTSGCVQYRNNVKTFNVNMIQIIGLCIY